MKTELSIQHWKTRRLLPISDPGNIADSEINNVHYQEALRAFCDGDFSAARRKIGMILVNSSENTRALAACGHAWLHDGNREKAIEYYDRAEQIGGDLSEIQYNRALIYSSDGRWSDALPILQNLYATPPAVRKGRFYFGLIFKEKGELLAEVSMYLGLIHQNLGRLREAHDWYEKSLKHHPKSIPVHQRIAEIEIISKSYVSAIGHLNKILELTRLEEDKIHAHNNLGIANYENGDLEEAISHLNWVLRSAPGNPTAIHNLNFIYENEGFLEKEEREGFSIRFMDVKEGASPIFGLRSDRGEDPETDVIIGKSAAMARVMRHARVASAAESPVMITGASGTGKELLAQVIAHNSSRSKGPFKVVTCGGKEELILESEIFGHEKGAFTSARTRRHGVLEHCAGGTVLIKEIEKLSPLLQSRLLRAMRDGHFSPSGGVQEIPLTVRLIACTNQEPSEILSTECLREDLFYELNVIPINLPLLRERREDLPLLVKYFVRKHSRSEKVNVDKFLSPEDLAILMEYDWPGNVRELENFVARAVIVGSQSNIYMEELAKMRRNRSKLQASIEGMNDKITYPMDITLADLERRHILSVLELNDNNQRRASKILGINPSTLWRKLKNYEK